MQNQLFASLLYCSLKLLKKFTLHEMIQLQQFTLLNVEPPLNDLSHTRCPLTNTTLLTLEKQKQKPLFQIVLKYQELCIITRHENVMVENTARFNAQSRSTILLSKCYIIFYASQTILSGNCAPLLPSCMYLWRHKKLFPMLREIFRQLHDLQSSAHQYSLILQFIMMLL